MKLGIIGTGNMGTILIQSLIEGAAVSPEDLLITNRTIEKAFKLKAEYPEVHIVRTAVEVTKNTDIIFVCIKPLDIYPLLEDLKDELSPDQCLVSITSPVTVEQIESVVPCHVIRVIPSIVNRSLSGSTLVTFGKRCGEQKKKQLLDILKKFSTPVCIEENVTRVASDICSCGPAFFSYLLERFIQGAVQETEISREQATQLTSDMIIGLGKLLEKNIYTLSGLKEKVTVKGGVTGVGLNVLESGIGEVFEHLFQKTQEKFKEDHLYVDKQFGIIKDGK
ncbi:competence protein ComER [Scopulibacillus daqui]|uniref:Pyrroline-5-carboxylate reductase n=1 Tax=Scopulibacillus daqui TaxID=1469162 RepID=A0ABS2Q0J6_9BACL|nr:late competence protein ComER [Scopulibacillus daqui]MBM7645823.1 competence protein ComER [Scopulibacillus daqui]